MRRLREYASALQKETKLPSRPPSCAFRLVDDDRVEKPASAYELDERGVEGADGRAEVRAEGVGALREVLVD